MSSANAQTGVLYYTNKFISNDLTMMMVFTFLPLLVPECKNIN